MIIDKKLLRKIITFAIPKIIILFLAFVGFVHIWYSINYCEVTFRDHIVFENWTRTIYANFNELPYFFNTTNGRIILPPDAMLNCSIAINPKREKNY
jgi:hypothetical protein